jgi:hypothetical protein
MSEDTVAIVEGSPSENSGLLFTNSQFEYSTTINSPEPDENSDVEALINWQMAHDGSFSTVTNIEEEEFTQSRSSHSWFSSILSCFGKSENEVGVAITVGEPPKKEAHKKLTELPATAICGNDITSSCLYVIGLCTSYAGMWSPLCLLIVALLLFLFKVCEYLHLLIL